MWNLNCTASRGADKFAVDYGIGAFYAISTS